MAEHLAMQNNVSISANKEVWCEISHLVLQIIEK